MTVLEFCAEEDFPRADVFFSGKAALTRSAVKKLADEGRLFLNGVPVKANKGGKAGDTVRAEIPDPEPIEAVPEDIPLNIVYEDSDIAVVNKPQGMTVHAGNG
ncbi:MAG: RNA pseudouridine synthase, partial [Clostridiales bacterium]|nr:RNA pseudouridine synthase [Clostridiales bacterium]